MIYFNPAVFTKPTAAVLSQVHELDPTDVFYNMHHSNASPSREAAQSRNISGYVYFMEDGKLYTALSTATFDFKEITEEPALAVGINWCSAHFLTEEKAKQWVEVLQPARWEGVPHPEYGTYEIHYHMY